MNNYSNVILLNNLRRANLRLRRLGVMGLIGCALLGSAAAHSPAEDMAEAVVRFLAALTPEQRTKAVYAWKAEERFNWHYIPRGRAGLPFKEMTPAQRHLAQGFLSTGLSHRGYFKATTIMSLEQVLHDLETRGPERDPDLYFFTIFGQPGPDTAWGWRVEGHHLSLNFTLDHGQVAAVTPSFFGSNPAEVKEGPRRGLRVLANEEDLGRSLVKSLDPEQLKTALISSKAPSEIVTGNSRRATIGAPVGLPAAKMSARQVQMLQQLLHEYVDRYRPELAEADWQKIQRAGLEQVFFAWAGGLERGEPHYYRLQGPSFLMEYDNTQNNANHIHSVWRDFQNDFGDDVLRRHYDQDHHAGGQH